VKDNEETELDLQISSGGYRTSSAQQTLPGANSHCYIERPGLHNGGNKEYMLRRKNRLTRKGRVEKASTLAVRIGTLITKRSKSQLIKITPAQRTSKTWAAVR